MANQQPVPIQMKSGYGTVKQVISGDVIVLRGTPRGGPPEEITIVLDGIVAPKLAVRPIEGKQETPDMPFAFEAREFLRKKLIGKRVYFQYKVKPGDKDQDKKISETKTQQREFGMVYDGLDTNAENVTETLVSRGLVDVKKQAARNNEFIQKLIQLEDAAKAGHKGKHAQNASETFNPRNIQWELSNVLLNNLKDELEFKPQPSIVEHVVDGSSVRILMRSKDCNTKWYAIKMLLSGIKCHGFSSGKPEPFAEEAKFFVESRLLQRDVTVIIEAVSNLNCVGSILHPNGNIAELLLKEGYAKCVDWSLHCCTQGIEKLRAAEKTAKEKRLRLWKDYVPSGPQIDAKDREFHGKVVEIVNADALVIKLSSGISKKIFLSSIRPPRSEDSNPDQKKLRSRALYDIPYMFEAREFLRKKLIGKKVHVIVDYKQAANQGFAERICCTVTIDEINVAEALISKGFATVVRYRADEDQRSSRYDDLLSAEIKASKSGKGVHGKKDSPNHRIVDLSGDVKNSKQYFPILQRAGRMVGIVEFVASGSRLRVYIPRHNYLLTFLLGGISCARAAREIPGGSIPGDPYGDDALAFTKDLCMQKEVQIEVESMDKAGNYIGWLWIDGGNLSEALVQEGMADVHQTAIKSQYYKALTAARDLAQTKKIKMWQNYEVVEEESKEDKKDKEDNTERSVKYKEVSVTETKEDQDDLIFYAQHFDEGPKLEELMNELRQEFATAAPLTGSYTPKKGDICAVKFSQDEQWYRGKIVKVHNSTQYLVLFIDYGNKELRTIYHLASLPAKYLTLPPCAHEYALAFTKLPKDMDCIKEARSEFRYDLNAAEFKINIEYKTPTATYATLITSEDKDIGKSLVEQGFLLVEKRKDRKFKKIMSEYSSAQETAKKNRANIWMYGDITEDDAKEFG